MKIFKKIAPVLNATPLMLFLTMVLPQVLLMVFRARTLYIIGDALKENAPVIHANYLLIPAALILFAVLLMLYSRSTCKDLPQIIMLGMLLLQSGALVLFMTQLDKVMPSRVLGTDAWAAPEGPFLMLQLAAAMPGIFYSFICGANIRLFERMWINIVGNFCFLVLVPSSLYFIGIVGGTWIPSALFTVPVFVVSTLIAAFAFLQLILLLFNNISHGWILMLVFGLFLPLCGMALNTQIPFPADLQHWGIYALTVINAAILLASYHPKFVEHPAYGALVALCYPFSCYFFFLFLPFLPFSLIAMILAGAGFLILSPTVLFVMHSIQLAKAYKRLAGSFNRGTAFVCIALAFMVIPAAYVGRAYVHKNVFLKTLDAVYAQNYDEPLDLPSPSIARYALVKMKESKEGFYVPILSEVYNSIVFGGMILPDKKMKQLSKLLIGEDYDHKQQGFRDISFYSMFTNDSRRRSGRGIRAPSRNTALTAADVSGSVSSNGVTEASLLLKMKNRGSRQAEFRTDIEIPQGVFVSGYELRIEGEMIPGRLSDRRAAMWVYHMIRDRERRDPGLLVYTAPGKLRLSVFPFAPKEERACLIKFLYPQGARPMVKVGGRSVALPDKEAASVHITTIGGTQALYIPADYINEDQGVKRSQQRVLLAGIDETPGYCPEWDVKRGITKYLASGDEQLKSVPLFITKSDKEIVEIDGALWWLPQIPDSAWLKNSTNAVPAPRAVIPFKCGDNLRAVNVDVGGLILFNNLASIERFDGQSNSLKPFTADRIIKPESRYARSVDLWQQWWLTELYSGSEQGVRGDLIHSARELNILIPSAAFLAVESKAQAKALKAAEKKSLKKHKSFGFDEFEEEDMLDSPEPSIWLLMTLLLPVMWWRGRRPGAGVARRSFLSR